MSRPCGGGVKERKVECKQIMAQEHKVERRDELCPSMKPQHTKPCNPKPCAPEDQHPPIAVSNTTYIQHDPKKTKVTLKIGGAATVFYGTQIKIKCPVKRYVGFFTIYCLLLLFIYFGPDHIGQIRIVSA